MIRELDTRKFDYHADEPKLQEWYAEFAREVSRDMPGEQSVSFSGLNRLTGSPDKVAISNALPIIGSIIEQALTLAKRTTRSSSLEGFATTETPEVEYVPDPRILTTSSGSQVVHLAQYYRGIPVFQMSRTVQFSPEQTPRDISGTSIPFSNNVQLTPAIDVVEAARLVHKYINANQDVTLQKDGWGQSVTPKPIRKTKYVPKVVVRFDQPSQPTVLSKGPFDEFVLAHLVIFHQGPRTRLGWYFLVSLKDNQGQYCMIVSADDEGSGEILYVRSLTLQVKAKGNVFLHNGDGSRQMVDFPIPLADLPAQAPGGLPISFPPDWVSVNQTVGNNTYAVPYDPATKKSGSPTFGKDVGGVLTFDPSDPASDEQKVLNIFYYCNYMHDFFYLLGFDEASGNFQWTNFSGGGLGGDHVEAISYPDQIEGTATMGTSVDSRRPRMSMGTCKDLTGVVRHTAFDADVVFHEFTHGVTNRLVGGPMNTWALEADQSRGLGEGWSDYFALTIHNYVTGTDKTVVADWVTGKPTGIRNNPYDDKFPDGFDKLGLDGVLGSGSGSVSVSYTWDKPHNLGEIWCATLMCMTRNISLSLGREQGYQLCWQIVVDGLKVTPENPNFLQARDAILKALDDMSASGSLNAQDYTKARRGAWEAFAKFGMGINAGSNGPYVLDGGKNIHADFTLPAGL